MTSSTSFDDVFVEGEVNDDVDVENLVVLVDDEEDVEGELAEAVDCLDAMKTTGVSEIGGRISIGSPLTIGRVVVVVTEEERDDVVLVDDVPSRDESYLESVGHSRGTNTGSQ